MNQLNRVEVVFAEGEKFKVTELSNYLYHLKAVYTHLYDAVPETLHHMEPSALANNIGAIIQNSNLGRLRGYPRGNLFNRDLGTHDVYIEAIEKKSPLTILFVCAVGILVAGVVISGGELDLSILGIGKIRVKTGPLGDGLKKLKDLFRR